MNTKNLLLIIIIFISASLQAQLDIVYPGSTESLNGTTQTYTFPSSSASAVPVFDYTIHFDVVNNSGDDLAVACRRIETDVMPGINSTTCWLQCPLDFESGLIPDWIVGGNQPLIVGMGPGETNNSFVFHYKPLGVEGSSTYNVRFVNAEDTDQTYAEINLELNHLTNSITELDGNIEIELSPMPANDFLNINADIQADDLFIEVYNLMGTNVLRQEFTNLSEVDNISIDTSELPNGMYMLSIGEDGRVAKTTRLIVQH